MSVRGQTEAPAGADGKVATTYCRLRRKYRGGNDRWNTTVVKDTNTALHQASGRPEVDRRKLEGHRNSERAAEESKGETAWFGVFMSPGSGRMCHRADESIGHLGSCGPVSCVNGPAGYNQPKKITQAISIVSQAPPMHIITGENSRGSLEGAGCPFWACVLALGWYLNWVNLHS